MKKALFGLLTMFVIIVSLNLLLSCDDSPAPRPVPSLNGIRQINSNVEKKTTAPNPNVNLVVCPMCNGTKVFDYMPGDIMAPKTKCSGCNGQGVVDPATAAEIMKIQQQFTSTRNTNSGSSYSGNNECERCHGTGLYKYLGVPNYSGGGPQWTTCRNCGEIFDAHNSHTCSCRVCGGYGCK